MVDLKNYVGKVVRINYLYNNKECSEVGVVYKQEERGDKVSFSMLLTNGQSWAPTFDLKNISKISSARIDEALRGALIEYCKVKIKQEAFLENFWKEKSMHENNVSAALKAVKEHSDELTVNDCMDAITDLFQDRYPSGGGFHSRNYFYCTSGCSTDITISHCQEIEKYASPESYPFLYREYDGCIFVRRDSKAHKDFCERNAPAVKPELKQFKSEIYATIGDKNFLSVERAYKIPLKYGLSKRSVDYIKEAVFGIKKSLTEVIESAQGQKSSSSKSTKEKEYNTRDR